jgi:hypothetical protein
VQMPPKAISRQAWTTPERIGAAIILWTGLIVGLSIGIIVWKIAAWVLG